MVREKETGPIAWTLAVFSSQTEFSLRTEAGKIMKATKMSINLRAT